MKLFAICILSMCLFTACGFDVVSAEDDYSVPTYDTYTQYDWYQSSSSTVIPSQTYNNYGTGTIVVNNGYMSSSSARYVHSSSSITAFTENLSIESIKFELHGNRLYGTNLTNSQFRIQGAYIGKTPGNIDMFFKPYLTDNYYVTPDAKCLTITSILFYHADFEYTIGKQISSWTGNFTVCE